MRSHNANKTSFFIYIRSLFYSLVIIVVPIMDIFGTMILSRLFYSPDIFFYTNALYQIAVAVIVLWGYLYMAYTLKQNTGYVNLILLIIVLVLLAFLLISLFYSVHFIRLTVTPLMQIKLFSNFMVYVVLLLLMFKNLKKGN